MRHIVWAIAVVAVALHSLGCTFPREGACRAGDALLDAKEVAIRVKKADLRSAQLVRETVKAERELADADLERFEAGLKFAAGERRRLEAKLEIARKTKAPAVSEVTGQYELAVAAERAANQALATSKAGSAAVDAHVSEVNAAIAAASAALRAAEEGGDEASKTLGRAREEWATARLKTAEAHHDYVLAKQARARAQSEYSALEENLANRKVCIEPSDAALFGNEDFPKIATMECFGLLEARIRAEHRYDVESLRTVSVELTEAAARIDEAKAELAVVRAETLAKEHPGAEANAALDRARAGQRAARLDSALAHKRCAAADIARAEVGLDVARKQQAFLARRAEKTRDTELGKVIQEMPQTAEVTVRSALRAVEAAKRAMVAEDRLIDAVRAQNAHQ